MGVPTAVRPAKFDAPFFSKLLFMRNKLVKLFTVYKQLIQKTNKIYSFPDF